MQFIKKSALGVCASLLVVSLFSFGLTLGLYRLIASPEPLKGALQESGIYQSAVGDVLAQAQKEQGPGEQGQGEEKIPLDNPDVQNVIKSAASPDLLQGQVENALDSLYAWLRGETPNLQLSVELGEAKNRLADGLAQHIEQKLAALPACAPGAAPSGDVDPFNATCLPQGVTPAQTAAEAKNQLLSGDFLKETTFTTDQIKGDDGRTLSQQFKDVPAVYEGLKWAVYGTGALALLLAVAVVFLSATRRKGLKKVSIIFIVIGAVTAGLGWLAGYGIDRAAEVAKEPLQQSGVRVGEALVNDLQAWWLWYGVVLIIIGAVTLTVLFLTRQKSAAGDDQPDASETEPGADTHEPAAKDEPHKPEHKTAPTQKPKPARKLVQ